MEPAVEKRRVTTIELFFDLVFVFTITQITHLVEGAHGPAGYGRALLVLAVIWWMYAGYVWLTSNLDLAQVVTRLLLLAGMAGFLVMALAVPVAFGDGQLALGIGYVWVVAVHAITFATKAAGGSTRAIWAIAPFNLAAGAAVAAGWWLPAGWRWLAWAAAVAILVASSLTQRERGFTLDPAHFTERHGLVLIVVLGESLVAIGGGASEQPVDWDLVAAIVVALALVAALWWSYFNHDDGLAEAALERADSGARARLALTGFGYAFLALLAGVVVVSAGLEQVLSHLGEKAPGAAVNLGLGVSVYLAGQALFRWVMGIGSRWGRPVAAAAALATIPLGRLTGPLTQMWLLLALLLVLLLTDP